jgi:hypothetical protein
MMSHRVKLTTLLIVLFIAAQFAAAEDIDIKSSIVGTFTGSKTIASEGVTVRLVDSVLLQEVARTITGKEGKFLLPNLLPGLYLITVDAGSMKGLFKRVQVASGSPTFIDIRPLESDGEEKQTSAWERFKWTIRMAERNPLRQDAGAPLTDDSESADGLMAALRNFQHANGIEGAVSYLSVGGGANENIMTHQLAQVAVQGRLDDVGSWTFNGNYLDGFHTSYFAHGGMDYQFLKHNLDVQFTTNDLVFAQYPELQSHQRIARFVESPEESIEDSRWVTSIAFLDNWAVNPGVDISYGVRIDYYGYLRDAIHYSPRLGVSFDVAPDVQLHGAYFKNAVAPGNVSPASQDLQSYVHEIAFVPYGTSLVPETVEGFQSGVDFSRNDYRFAVMYTYQTAEDKIATVDVRNTAVSTQLQTLRPFVIFNATNQSSHEVGAQFEKRISNLLTASATYNITKTVPIFIVEKGAFATRQMYFRRGEKLEGFHDVQAGITADIAQTGTQVSANWKWSSGSPLIFGRRDASGPLQALDVEVYQGLPIGLFSQSDLKLLVAIQNVLDTTEDASANADYYRALQYDMPRVIAGGVLIEF